VKLSAPSLPIARVVEPFFPVHHARERWKRSRWTALSPRLGELLLLHLTIREDHSTPGAVRNHWRRRRIDAASVLRRQGQSIPDFMFRRILDKRELNRFRLAHAKGSLEDELPNKSCMDSSVK
jgi:hypothetical protein